MRSGIGRESAVVETLPRAGYRSRSVARGSRIR